MTGRCSRPIGSRSSDPLIRLRRQEGGATWRRLFSLVRSGRETGAVDPAEGSMRRGARTTIMNAPDNQMPDDTGPGYIEARSLVEQLAMQRSERMPVEWDSVALSETESLEPDAQRPPEPDCGGRISSANIFHHADVGHQLRLLAIENGDTTHLSNEEAARFEVSASNGSRKRSPSRSARLWFLGGGSRP